jgi:tRNA-specific 2-thiouridylase
MQKKVAVAMSGGVDSSVAAALLLESGCELTGITQKLWCYGEDLPAENRVCCSLASLNTARLVCASLGFTHYVLDFEDEFKSAVLLPFVKSYLGGQTPNPCIWCNSRIRFGSLLNKVKSIGCDKLATGHYARIICSDGTCSLYRGVDRDKDQSYFLWELRQDILGELLFPLGESWKEDVRKKARSLDLPTASRPESQDLCFGGGQRMPDLLRSLVERERIDPPVTGFDPGEIVDSSGRVVGTHRGTAGFTIGQRRKLAVSSTEPLYVLSIEPEENRVRVGGRAELLRDSFAVEHTNWFQDTEVLPAELMVKTRYRRREAPCSLRPESSGRWLVQLKTPQEAIAPGQSAVFYEGDRLVGGGVIASH